MTIHVHHLTHGPVVTQTAARCQAAAQSNGEARRFPAIYVSFSPFHGKSQRPAVDAWESTAGGWPGMLPHP
jgi:hypothetical protein